MTGFSSGLNSDSTIYTPDGERIVMWQELPSSGTPEDFDLLTDLRYSAQKLYTSKYFKGESQGDVIANVGMGIKYTQHVHNTRIVKDGVIFSEAISSSSLKSVADQRYIDGDNVLIRPASSISGGNASFGSTVNKIPLETYYARYGARANELSKYVINNSTIKSVKDENAGKAQKNAERDGTGEEQGTDGEITFDVPQKLIADEDGNYKFTLTLDPTESTKYYRNEVRTLASADENPVFYSVSITITIDGKFNPIKVTSRENYDIAIPVLGAMNCTSTLTEVFTDIDDETKDIPDREFFESHIDDAGSGDGPIQQLSPADYLAAAFGDYLDGSKALDLTADLDIAGVKLDKLKLSVDMATMNIRAKLGKLNIQYINDKVYLTLNGIKGFMSVSAFSDIIDDPAVGALLGGLKLPDFDELLGGDLLSTVFADCEMTTADGITCIRLPFDLTEDISVDASLYIADDGMELRKITGTVKAFGIEVTVDAAPAKNLSFPAIDGSYKDLSAVADFIPAAMHTAMGSTYGITGSINVNGLTVGIDAYLDREDGIKADASLSVLGQNLDIKYINDTLYAKLGNLGVKATAEQIPTLIDALSELITLDTSKLDMLLKLLPDTVDEWLGTVQSLDVTDSSLSVGINIIGIPVNIELKKNADALIGLYASINVNMFGVKLDATVDLAVTSPEKREVTAEGEYIDAVDLLPALDTVLSIIEEGGVTVDASLNYGELKTDATVKINASGMALSVPAIEIGGASISLDAAVIDGTAYIAVGGSVELAFRSDINELKETLAALKGILPEEISGFINTLIDALSSSDIGSITDILQTSNLDIQAVFDTLLSSIGPAKATDGVLTAVVSFNGVSLAVSAATDLSRITVDTVVNGTFLSAAMKITAGAEFNLAAADYIPLENLVPVINAVLPYATEDGITASFTVNALGTTIDGALIFIMPTTTTELCISARVDIGDVYISLALTGGNIYVDLNNGIKLTCGTSASELDRLANDLKPVLDALGAQNTPNAVISALKSIIDDPMKLLNAKIALGNAENNGLRLTLDLTEAGLDITAEAELSVQNGKLDAIILNATAFENDINIKLDAETDEYGKLISLATEIDEKTPAAITLGAAQSADIAISGDYVSILDLTRYVAPLLELISPMQSAKAITLSLDALLRVDDGDAAEFGGSVTIALSPELAVEADVFMFKNTADAEHLYVKYVGGVLYLRSGNIKLKFDTATDTDRIYDMIASKLPKYLADELAKLFGKMDGASAFSDIGLLIERIKAIAAATSPEEIVNLLLTDLGGLKTDSALKTMLDMISVKKRAGSDNVTFTVDLMGIGINITPALVSSDGNASAALGSVDIDASISIGKNVYLAASVYGITPKADEVSVISPEDASEYVSIAEFTDTIDSVLGTFTARDKDGNITFEITDLDFAYNEKDGKDSEGNAVKGSSVTVKNIEGKKALRGRFAPVYKLGEDGMPVTDADGEKIVMRYEFSLEAHITLTIGDGGDTGPIDLELYLTRDGKACLDYFETKTQHGERVTIDYESVMQIVAAVLDIIAVDNETVEKLVGDYRQPIDTTVFKSMDIVGLDSLKTTLTNLVVAADDLKAVVNDFNAMLDTINTAGSIENLKTLMPQLKTDFDGAIAKLKSILAMFGGGDSPKNSEGKSAAELYKQIVNGVTFRKTVDPDTQETVVGADVENSVTVGTEGQASIDVSRKNNALTRLQIKGLDVDTALVAGDIRFTAGETFDTPIALPDAIDAPTTPNTSYSNFSDIKHLLFDVMNTANLMEYEIGDSNSYASDRIELGIKLLGVESINIKFSYNIRVKLVDQGEGAEPRFKTMAIVEFVFRDCTAAGATVVPNCTTRLYFYDNTFYIQGIESWSKKLVWFHYEYTFNTVFVKYGLDEFTQMMSSDMSRFLNEFVFYLMPLSTDFSIAGVDLKAQIANSVSTPSTSVGTPTIATVYKGYTYNEGKHELKLGLTELTGNSMLGDVNVSLTGANDGDDNILDNYISNLSVTLSLVNNAACTINLRVYASLRNVEGYELDGVNRIRSRGLSNVKAQSFDSTGCDPLASDATASGNGYTIDAVLSSLIPSTNWDPIWA